MELIRLLDDTVSIRHFYEMNDEEFEALAGLTTAMINCGPLPDGSDCVHDLEGDGFPGPLAPLLIDFEVCAESGVAEPSYRSGADQTEQFWAKFRAKPKDGA